MALKPNLIIEESVLKVRTSLAIYNEERTFLTADSNSGSSTLTVENINGFGVSDYLIIGQVGNEETELVQVHAVTAPSGTTITLTGTTARAHARDTYVQRVSYNQIEFSRATSSGGGKSVLTTVDLQVDQEFTVYNDTTNTTGYAYARFKNSTSTTYSEYSDEQAYENLAYNSVARIIDRVFSKANEVNESFITRKEVLDYVWDGIDAIEDIKMQLKCEDQGTDISNATTLGGEVFTLPSDIKYPDERSIISVAISGEKPLGYLGTRDFYNTVAGQARTTLNGAVSSGAATIVLTDATYFSDAGTGYIDGDTFTWTGKSTNTLTGVSGVLDHDDGDVAVQSSVAGTPVRYTIINGIGHLTPPCDETYDNRVLMIDYYRRLTHPDSENDVLPLPYVSPIISYCLMCVYQKKEAPTIADRYSNEFDKRAGAVIRNERTSQPQQFSVKE